LGRVGPEVRRGRKEGPERMGKGGQAALGVPGAAFTIRATPRAREESCVLESGLWRSAAGAPAEDGRSNAPSADALAARRGRRTGPSGP